MMRVVVFALLIVVIGGANARAADRPPNVVFFLVDDLGQRDVGCYGSRFHETPFIDRLATEGMLFHNAYSTCHVCSPSRASILTGKYPARINLTDWLGGRPERDYEKLHSAKRLGSLPDEERTLAETLKAHGYVTANYGKAHLNRDPKTYGFDEAITGWVRSYYHPFSRSYTGKLPSKPGDYYTDKLTDAAIDFIERNKNKPFFVHLEHFAVHDPIQGRKDLVEKYKKKLASMPAKDGAAYVLETNPDGPTLSAEELEAIAKNQDFNNTQDKRVWWVKQRQDNVEFAGMLEAVDQSLGRIRAKLKEFGLDQNTIIVFTSDNGGMAASNQYREISKPRNFLDRRFATSNLPLRGAKGWNYEGGIRVPLVVYWPGQIKSNTKSDAIVTGTDYYPTLLEMLGLPTLPKQHVDGKSFVPALKGKDHDRGAIFWHFPHYSNHGYQSPNGAIRLGKYKLIEYFENGTIQLFDLDNDIGEKHDLSRKDPEIAKKLLNLLHAWRKDVDAQMPAVKSANATRQPKSSQPEPTQSASKNLAADVERFAAGWKVRDWGGPKMNPGLRSEWRGRKNVLLTHPRSKEAPCVLFRKLKVPAGRTVLKFAVTNHPQGDWDLVVRVNGKKVVASSIADSKWKPLSIDLSDHAGKTVEIELENRASGWSFEAAYWSGLRLVAGEK
jgi:arylsulfatase A